MAECKLRVVMSSGGWGVGGGGGGPLLHVFRSDCFHLLVTFRAERREAAADPEGGARRHHSGTISTPAGTRRKQR